MLLRSAAAAAIALASPVLSSNGTAEAVQQQSAAEPVMAAGWRTTRLPDGTEVDYLVPTITHGDYPKASLRAEIEGTSVLRLTVSPRGRILSCETFETAGAEELDARACQLYHRRARYRLRNATAPVVLLAPIVWRIENRPEVDTTPR